MPDDDGSVPDHFSVRRVDHVAALRHLDPAGALSGLDLDDHEGLAIRAALDVWGLSLDPTRAGDAAIRVTLKEVLIRAGLWPASKAATDEGHERKRPQTRHGRPVSTC